MDKAKAAFSNMIARTRTPHFRQYGQIFLMSSMLLAALAHKDDSKASWDAMNRDTSMYVGPWAKQQQQQNGGVSASSGGSGVPYGDPANGQYRRGS